MKPQKLPPFDSVDDTAVRTLVAHIVDVLLAQRMPLPIALHAMGFCAAILLRKLLDAGIDAKPDFLRGLAKTGPIDLTVTGHSLGGAIAIVATAWLLEPLNFSLWPHTFAAPTMWNAAFATSFARTFAYYAAVNTNDIVPMAWANLSGVLATFRRRALVCTKPTTTWVIFQ